VKRVFITGITGQDYSLIVASYFDLKMSHPGIPARRAG
jgi:hypothetical protein